MNDGDEARARQLAALMTPESVAIIGASNDGDRIGGRPLRYYRAAGFAGDVYPINPNRAAVQGVRAFPDIRDVGRPIDLALLAVPYAAVQASLAGCVAAGVKAAVLFSAGFAEAGAEGAELQRTIAAYARQAGIALLGPNCLGVVNAAIGHTATFGSFLDPGPPVAGPIAVVSQSGAYGTHLYLNLRRRRLGVGLWLTTGNEIDVTIADGVRFAATRDETRVILIYAEAIRDGAALLDAIALARAAGKAVAILKVGRTASGQRAAASHTAALASDTRLTEALIRQAGACWANTTEDLLDFGYAAARAAPTRGNRLGILTVSGGAGIVMADAAAATGLDVVDLPAPVQAAIRARNPFASAANPVDVSAHAFNDPSLIGSALADLLGADAVDSVAGFLMNWPDSPSMGPAILAALRDQAGQLDRVPISLALTVSDEMRAAIEDLGYLVFDDATRAVTALDHLAQLTPRTSADDPPVPPHARPLLTGPVAGEAAAKALIAAIGIPIPVEQVCADEAAARAAAQTIGYPVALKLVSPDIAHKSEVGGVALGLGTPDALGAALATMRARVTAAAPAARIDGYLVSPMLTDGVEAIVGVRRDPSFGAVVVVGLGGIFAEIFEDVAFARCPIGPAAALALIDGLKGAPLLNGARGRPKLDRAALADAVSRLSAFAAAADDFDAIEINPLLVRQAGVVALDAHVVDRDVARAPHWTYADFLPGGSFGRIAVDDGADRAAAFHRATDTAGSALMSPGLIVAEMMRGYTTLISMRPPGNIHAGIDLAIHRQPAADAPLRIEIGCRDKSLRRGRKRVEFDIAMRDTAGEPVADARLSMIWAE